MYFIGYGSSTKLRSSVLYHIGKRDKYAVYDTIWINTKYFLITVLTMSVALLVLRQPVATLFFTDAELRSTLAELLKWFALFAVFECMVPMLSTMLRIFDMNLYATLILVFVFGLLFLAQNYLYVLYQKLECFSPVVTIIVCNLLNCVISVGLIWKNCEKSLDKKLIKLSETSFKLEMLL